MARKKATKTVITKTEIFEDPQSRNEALLWNILGASNDLGDPQSRNEALLMNILGESYDIGEAQSRIETLLMRIKEEGLGTKITADDLGKVVQETAPGEYGLTAQTAHAEITENGEYDTTTNNSVTVNVAGSGGNSIASGEILFEQEQSTIPPSAQKISIEFDLDHIPNGVMWYPVNNTNGTYTSPNGPGGGETITPTVYYVTYGSSGKVNNSAFASGANNIWTSLNATAKGLDLFIASGYRYGKYIPAGTTIRWVVW